MPFSRDMIGGLILLGFAVLLASIGTQYRLGSFLRMGPGLFPLMISGILGLLGLAILIRGWIDARSGTEDGRAVQPLELRPATAVILGTLAFALLIEWAGLIPATLVLVGAAALAEESPRAARTVILAVALTALSVAIFPIGLGINIPILRWPF